MKTITLSGFEFFWRLDNSPMLQTGIGRAMRRSATPVFHGYRFISETITNCHRPFLLQALGDDPTEIMELLNRGAWAIARFGLIIPVNGSDLPGSILEMKQRLRFSRQKSVLPLGKKVPVVGLITTSGYDSWAPQTIGVRTKWLSGIILSGATNTIVPAVEKLREAGFVSPILMLTPSSKFVGEEAKVIDGIFVHRG